MRSRKHRSITTYGVLALLGVLTLPAAALDTSRQVLIEAAIVEVDRAHSIELGIATLRPNQRPSQQDAEIFVPVLENAVTGLNQLNLDVGNYPDVDGTLDGSTAQSLNSFAVENLDVAIEALENQSKARQISRPLLTAFSSQVAAIAAFQGRPARFSSNANRRRREVQKYDTLFAEAFDGIFPHALFFTLGDYFEPFDKVKKRGFDSFTGLELNGDAGFKLRRRRGNTVLEFRGQSDDPTDAFVVTPIEVGDSFSATADMGLLLKVTPKLLTGAAGITMVIEVDQPDEGTFQIAGFQFGTNGIAQAYTANEGGIRSVVPIDLPNIDTSKVTSLVHVNGGTVILGGLFEKTDGSGERVPFLLDEIPILGSLFRTSVGVQGLGKGQRPQVDNLIVFVTPRILIQEEE